jgi:ABC-2 type transport system permease protein
MNAFVESSNEHPVASKAADFPKSRLFYWSVRRELWENRSILFGPIGIAALMLAGFVVGAPRFADAMRAVFMLHPDRQAELLAKPISLTAVPIIVTAIVVAVFYCLDALHGERHDRSILFWKSLPVSDLVTVLSKAAVPLVVLPAVACATFMVLQFVILIVGSVVLQAGGLDGSVLWSGFPLARTWGGLVYDVFGFALWHAPIYGWFLLVSGWARRAAFLWAVLPPLALCLVEKIAFGTNGLAASLQYRLFGFSDFAFDGNQHHVADPAGLIASPHLWGGLVVAALFVAFAVWFRRYRQPI